MCHVLDTPGDGYMTVPQMGKNLISVEQTLSYKARRYVNQTQRETDHKSPRS